MPLLRALLSHYRHHPLQGVFLLVGIIIANVLLVATQLINAQAQASYAQGESLLNQQAVGYLVAANGDESFDQTDYIALRRQGFDQLVPTLEHRMVSQDHGLIEMMGVDWLALAGTSEQGSIDGTTDVDLSQLWLPPYGVVFGDMRMQQLGLNNGQSLLLENQRQLPPAYAQSQDMGHRGLMELMALQAISGRTQQISSVWVMPQSTESFNALLQALPDSLQYTPAPEPLQQAQLADSLHLNLAAMGLLSFVVGIFLAFNAILFSYTDRGPLFRRLRICGVSRHQLRIALIIELGVFVLLGTAIGYLAGAWIASKLLPGLGQTLAQLYNVYIQYPNRMLAGMPLAPLLMTMIAALVSAAIPMHQMLQQRILNRYQNADAQRQTQLRDKALLAISVCLALVAWLLANLATELWHALACLACVLLSGAFALPAVLRALLQLLQKGLPSHWPLSQWLIADCKWLLGPAAVALMAMTLALVANSGLNTMITSFRAATFDWLDQRLVAPVYFNVADAKTNIQQWIDTHHLNLILVERHSMTHSQHTDLEIASLPPTPEYRQSIELMLSLPNAKQLFADQQGIFISERHMRLDHAEVGQTVTVCPALPPLPILGAYRDYGNPKSQWLLDEGLFLNCWPQHQAKGTAMYSTTSLDWPSTIAQLKQELALGDQDMIDQQQLKQMAMSVFDKTFEVTQALNVLTLLVAGIGIFCAMSAIHHHRIRQQALLACLGVSLQQRLWLQLGQWTLFAMLSMAIVWPFGTLLAYVLASVVTPTAFGWSFATQLYWQHYPQLALLAAACLLFATFIPTLRLRRVATATLLKEVDE
ncbi:ABC transporter permease [Echinimonas agarilytica]|uniref:ABC3 transporter permease C-terminal domain-containing protein n=1 Tax=Echinimonas agarilytica TaxID=1215918 RepID=A0AA41W7H2_9GAMM|nr:ABC transporter permease [Echinimonas agarilytica]MCM2680072.1 hypothetical protein [Echinimonas agarilytica]